MTPADDREAFEHAVINLTQQVGKTGATRVHELPGETLTIFKDDELFEFARKCAALSTERAREPDSNSQNKSQSNVTDRWMGEDLPPWEHPQVQLVYRMLCDDDSYATAGDEHWEGAIARRIVQALGGGKPVAEASGSDEKEKIDEQNPHPGQQAGAES